MDDNGTNECDSRSDMPTDGPQKSAQTFCSHQNRRRMRDWIITSSSCYVNFHSKLIETIPMRMSMCCVCVWVRASKWMRLRAVSTGSVLEFHSFWFRTNERTKNALIDSSSSPQRRCNQKYEKTFKTNQEYLLFFSAEITPIATEDVWVWGVGWRVFISIMFLTQCFFHIVLLHLLQHRAPRASVCRLIRRTSARTQHTF